MKTSSDSGELFENLDFNAILFRQLDRIGQNSQDIEQFNQNVITLKLFISPFANNKFKETMEKIEEQKDDKSSTGKDRKYKNYEYHQKVLEAIMELFNDLNLLYTLKGEEEVNLDFENGD